MRGLMVEYTGVLDGSDEDQRRWRQLLIAARAHGVGTVVLSNEEDPEKVRAMQALHADGVVDAVVLAKDTGVAKPEPESFQFAADVVELDRRDCVLVDSEILNVRAAVDCGLVGVYYQQFDRAAVEIMGLFGLEGEF
ncbi:MAG: HAD hydrolase-like protein [Corynebacterium sp.]|nr:HAD hydrolase-like protein [Corynebacterium sp.]